MRARVLKREKICYAEEDIRITTVLFIPFLVEIYVGFLFYEKRARRDDTLSLFFRKYMLDFQEVRNSF